MSKKHRQEYIFGLLKHCDENSALSIADIIKRLGSDKITVNQRTIRRDIEELSLHYGISEVDSYPARFYLARDYHLKRELLLQEETLYTLILSLDYFKHTSHHYFYEYAQEAQEMILNSLPKEATQNFLDFKTYFDYSYSSAGKEQKGNKNSFKLIFKAIREQRIFHCLNESPYKDKEYNQRKRTFVPLKMVFSSHIPYLIVKDMDDKQVKRIRITRLREIELTERIDQTAKGIKLELNSSLGGYGGVSEESVPVLIYADRVVGIYFSEKKIHPSQRVEKTSSDEYKIFFQVALSNELIRLLASFGGHIYSVQPFEAWEKVQEIWKSGLKRVS